MKYESSIPRIIHYCWFGGKPLPRSAKKCIRSWKKYFPDYEIKEWNETNFDINCCQYVKEAYAEKKYAFVSDVARFMILYEYGGVYFDTDVEVIKSFDDILCRGGFMAVQNIDQVNPGLGIAAAPRLALYKELIDRYKSRSFLEDIECLNNKTIVEYTTEFLKECGLKSFNEIQQIAEIYVYPKEYFNPTNMVTRVVEISDETHSIHHYTASWMTLYERFVRRLSKIIGHKQTQRLVCVKRFLVKIFRKIGQK